MVNISGENHLKAVLACAASLMLLALPPSVSQLGGGQKRGSSAKPKSQGVVHLQGDSGLLLSGRLKSGALVDLCLAWQQRRVWGWGEH